ncbi:proliferation marker protein Ki-67 [Marmota marmota marmota]|nr:proliferation marker protein Ki-67 [Marmota marmota marmota]
MVPRVCALGPGSRKPGSGQRVAIPGGITKDRFMRVVVHKIKRSGADGAHFPLSLSSCLFGRGTECDIRIQLPVVSKQHCKIEIKEQKAILCNFSSTNPAQVNGSAIQEPVPLKHGDIITIIDRSFRYEDESRQNGSKSTESPGRTREQGPAWRASRAGSSADPDGKEQDSKAHSKIMERNAWGKPVEYAKEITGDSSALDGADPEPPSARSSEHQGQDGRNAGDTSSGDFKAKPRVTLVSGHGTPRSVASAQCFDNSKRSESPFKKLYQSMKEELDANPPGQNVQCHRKSGAHSGGTAERESTGGLQREPQLVLSSQPRRKSGRSTPMKEDPFPEPETSQTEKGSDLEPVEASKRLVGTSTPLSKMTRGKAPVPCPQLPSFAQEHKNEDLRVTLSESARVKAVGVTGTPGKLLIRNQAPIKAEGTANLNKKPENLSSRSRRSVPTNMEVLPAEIQSQPFLTQYLTQVEKKIQKESFNKPEKLGTAAGQICSGLPGLSSVDISNFGDSINKSEDLSLKRRRVSFGGRLRPELFDENLPPNTPLKKGETPAKRKSLAAHSPAVLKKIIKEQPASPGTESSGVCWEVKAQSVSTGSPAASPRITAANPGDQRRRSGKASAASDGNKSPQDTPKKAGRKSGQLSSKRTSISRSQHGILQMICSKRRSGASEANLIVAKSWADVVKLGAKQTQTKVVKHGPQRQVHRRQRRPNTPKKPTGPVHHQFSTGHANSPCTIIIGKAQIEKVTAPARPYRMLNNLVFSQKMDYNEDLSGLTEMFKTPVKEMTQRTTTSPSTLSSSEKLLGKKPQVTNSGGKPLPLTLEISGSNVLSSTQKTEEEPSETCFASPSLRRQSIRKVENTEKTPRNIGTMTHFEMRTPEFSPEPLKTVSSANKLRRSVELRNAEVSRVESKTEAGADAAGALPGRRLRETPWGGQEGGREESAQSEGKGGRVTDGRRSRTGGLKSEPTASLTDPEKTLNVGPWEDPSGSQRLPRTPGCTKETVNEEKEATKLPCGTPLPSPATPTASGKRQRKRSLGKVDVQEEASALRKRAHLPMEATHSRAAPGGDEESTGVLKGTPEQKKDSVVYGTGMKRGPRTPKKKTQPLEDLAGFKELFQTPKHTEESMAVDKKRLLVKFPEPGPVGTSTSTKTQVNTLQGRVDVKQECPAPERLRDTPREARHTGRASGAGGSAVRALEDSAQQALCPVANVTASRRQPGTPREKAQPLEDLAGFQELFQTPGRGKDPKTTGETTDAPCKSTGPEPRGTPTPSKRRPRTSLQKVEEKEALQALRKVSQSPGRAMHTRTGPVQEEKGVRALGTPRQKLDLTDNLSGLKRQRRTPKEKAQPLEDLAGFQELFQTPGWDKDPKTPGERTAPGGEDQGSRASEGSAQQARAPAARATGIRWLRGAPEAQPLEDLAGSKEPIPAPGPTEGLAGEGKTTKIPCESPEAEPVAAPAPPKRQPRAGLRKAPVTEEISVQGEVAGTSGGPVHTHPEPKGDSKNIKVLKEPVKRKLDPAAGTSGRKRRRGAAEGEAQPPEDLAGSKDPIPAPGPSEEPTRDEKTTESPCRSPQPEPGHTPASTKGLPRTRLRTAEVKEEPPAVRKPARTSRATRHTRTAPGGEDQGSRASEGSAQQARAPAARATGIRRLRGAPEAQPPEDLAGSKDPIPAPGPSEGSTRDEKTTESPCRSPQPEPGHTPASTKGLPRTRLRTAEVKEEPPAVRKPARTSRATRHTRTAPGGEDQGSRASEGSAQQARAPAARATGIRRLRGAPEAQPPEDLAGSKDPIPAPGPSEGSTRDEKTTESPCRSPQPEPGHTPASTKGLPRTRLRTAEVKEEPPAVRKPTRTSRATRHTRTAPGGEDQGSRASEGSAQQARAPAARATGIRRLRGAPEAQPPEDLAGSKDPIPAPGPSEGSTRDEKTTESPCRSPQPEPGHTPASTKGLPRTRLRTAEVKEEPPAVRKPTRTSRATRHTRTAPGGEDQGSRASEGSAQQARAPAARATGIRRLRGAPQGQPPEDLAGSKDPIPAPGPSEGPQHDAHSRKSTPEQTAERAKPLLTSSRVLRAPKGKPVEDQEGKGHPAALQSRSNMSLPTGKSGTDGLLSGVGVRCSETGLQDTVQAKAVHGKKRAAPRERGRSPEPLIINKDLKILINRIEPVEDHNSSREAGKRKLKVEDSASADKGILLRTRHQNTTEGEEPRPEITVSAEKMKIKRQGKKPMELSQEVGLQSPGDGDEKAESRAKVRGKRACLRAGIRNQISQPHTAEEEVRERSVAVPMKNQEEKGATANSDFRCLRSRKPGMQPSLESESEQRVTRGAKRCAENLKDKDTVDTKKLRSRSHRHRKDI